MRDQKTQYDPQKHHRKSIRWKGYDYTQAGAYFVTIVTHQRTELFGAIVDGEMILNPAGKIVQWEWQNLSQQFRFIELGAFIVMPNHFHGILIFHDIVGATHPARTSKIEGNPSVLEVHSSNSDGSPLPHGPKSGSLGAIIGQFKSRVTKRIWKMPPWRGTPIWQRNYYDRIIRDEREMDAIWRYIESNPLNWATDNENPVNA